MTITPERIQDLREMLAKATPGDWYLKPASYGWDVWGNLDDGAETWVGPVHRVISPHARIGSGKAIEACSIETESNARLITASRTAIPALLDEVERLQAELARVKAERDEAVALILDLWASTGWRYVDYISINKARAFISRTEGK